MEPDVIVIGPGAIGLAFGAALIDAGRVVRFAARAPFARLLVEYPGGRVDVPADVVVDPADVGVAPLVILATKAHQVAGAAAWLAAACRPDTVLAVLQNGVDHAERVEPFIGGGVEVLPAMVACPADRRSPGHAIVGGRCLLEVPRTPGGERFAAAFAGSFARVTPVDDMCSSLWRKLILNAVGGGIGTLARRGNTVFVDDPEAIALARAVAHEVAAVGRAEGAVIDGATVERVISALARGGGGHLPSIVVDRIAGRSTEWHARNEVVVRAAQRHGIPVPLNRMLTTLIRLGEPTVASAPEGHRPARPG